MRCVSFFHHAGKDHHAAALNWRCSGLAPNSQLPTTDNLATACAGCPRPAMRVLIPSCWEGSSCCSPKLALQLLACPPFDPSFSTFFIGISAATLRSVNHACGGMPESRKAIVRSTTMANSPEHK